MYKDRIKQYYFATVSEGEKYFQLKIQSILSNIKTHTLTWKSVSVKKKTMAREHSFQKQSKFQHQWAMWLTGCAVVLIVGIRPNKPIQWKKVLFLLLMTPFIDLSRCISESTDFSVGKSERCLEHGKIAYAHSHPTTPLFFSHYL